ncbi:MULTISPECIES: hypothetical protein [Paenibacillus]|uniref:DUF4190 domain-containing protein n=1 Tax=Paenibacillus campinasensis TaxID=66347 RepID=A0A268F4P8_9BACL|nr:MULTISPECIES: hypothetical protein [Paenibacillus]MUG64622.1 hypothetical protein [Paenibacillus campinasensis]PAD80345.1 hypothetical protein CHH67_01155 [Paenibacillus campinasensis]PAK55328.1 hypothetical protein CHH75_03475 [Paenibacillus sp. 7541]
MDQKRRNTGMKVIEGKRHRVDFPRKDHREEFSAEVASPVQTYERKEEVREASPEADLSTGRTVGYVGLVLGIISLFMWSVILGPIAAVVGYYAYNKGSRTMGAWGIGLGVLATLSYFILIPFAR